MASQKLSNQHLRAIIETQYQHRSALEHRTVLEIFLDFANRCSDRARLLSYFAVVPETGSVEISAQTVLFRRSQEGFPFLVEIQQSSRIARREESQLLILVPGEAIRKCQMLRWTSPENELRVLQSFPLLNEIPRKKIYQILRHSRVVELRYGETFFREGSVMSNSFYLVREGEFCFSSHNPALKEKELLRFRAGYLFQHQSKFIVEGYEEYLNEGNCDLGFDYTVKCKSSRGIIYCIDSNFFNMHIFKFCQERLGKHLRNQSSFLAQAQIPLKNAPSSSFSSITRPHSQQLQPLVASNISSARSKPRLSSSSRVLDLFEKGTDYRSVKESLPRRNRLFSKPELKKLMPDPQEDESDCLVWKKVKCERVKEMMMGLNGKELGLGGKESRGQILYKFTQSTIRFQKHRIRPSLL